MGHHSQSCQGISTICLDKPVCSWGVWKDFKELFVVIDFALPVDSLTIVGCLKIIAGLTVGFDVSGGWPSWWFGFSVLKEKLYLCKMVNQSSGFKTVHLKHFLTQKCARELVNILW